MRLHSSVRAATLQVIADLEGDGIDELIIAVSHASPSPAPTPLARRPPPLLCAALTHSGFHAFTTHGNAAARRRTAPLRHSARTRTCAEGGTRVRSYYFDQEKFADSRAYAGLPADLDIAKCVR